MQKLILGILILSFTLAGCKKDDDDLGYLPSCSSSTIFTHLPIAESNILNFIPLGHYNPPGHVFPSDHHYINIVKGNGDVSVYAPCDGWIINVSEYTSGMASFTEYAFELAPCKEIKVKFGHVTLLESTIMNKLTEVDNTDSYSTGGYTYTTNYYKTKIEVKAGEKIGTLKDYPEIGGLDFGTIDTQVDIPFINPDRFDNYGYVNAVSFLKYSSQTIKDIIYNKLQNDNGGYPLRTELPYEGEICYDVEGTAQGLWFKPGEPTTPEDPHLALIRHNFFPEKNVISNGISVPNLDPVAYEVFPEDSGTHNRSFDDITADGQIYSYSDFTDFLGVPVHELVLSPDVVILIQLVDQNTLRIEKQTKSDGPPWSFTSNHVDFER